MSWSTIFRIIPHFYFNYHYAQSASSYIHSSFIRRAQLAIRMVVSFLISAFLAYQSPLNNQLAQEFLMPLITVLSIQETFGLTVAASFQMVLGLVPTTIFLFIVQKIGLGYHNYLAGELLLLLSIFIIGLICRQSQSRKIPLALCAIFFATIVNQPILPSTFAFQLLEEFVIAMAVAVLVSFMIFPVFATMEIENRVNYCLLNLQEMQTFITEAFLRSDQMSAQIALTRASTIEQMIRIAIGPFKMKLIEARFEPSRCLQRIFNRQRRSIFDFTVKEQEDLIISWYTHIHSMQVMVKQCQFNDYHNEQTRVLEENLRRLCSCQLSLISAITKTPSITKDEFIHRVTDLAEVSAAIRSIYNETRRQQVDYALESGTTIRSEDHLGHAFFLFQLEMIVKLFTEIITTNVKSTVAIKKKTSIKERLLPKWPHLYSALKCTIIVGVGSIFVMVSPLAKVFENGQWILIAICMTQGDSVGGAFTTMKMRLLGTLLGAIWAYVTYLVAHDDVYQTFAMLVPWILIFGYIKTLPGWNYTAIVATFTPILINLGRIPYGNALPAGNFALLRIEENFVGIVIAIILTLTIFPVFAIDLLKDNIQTTLQACPNSVDSMRSIYLQLFPHEYSEEVAVDVEKKEEIIKSFFNMERDKFHQLITIQRTLIEHASVEPSFWWFNNNFSSTRYKALVQQEIELFQMLHNIDTALMCINEYSINENKRTTNIQLHPVDDHFLKNFHFELNALTEQLSDCLQLWSSYFALTQTRFHRFFSHCIYSQAKLADSDIVKHEQHLIELYQTIHRLQSQHQNVIRQLLDYYLDRLTQGDTSSNFVPYANSNKPDSMVITISAIYFSTTELARSAIALGTSIHTIFELETTHRYIHY